MHLFHIGIMWGLFIVSRWGTVFCSATQEYLNYENYKTTAAS